ncbi:anion permease [Pseudomonas massiliensis]|uniref:anion permease n=1 Tax=Pseudomonas massiliensis TaxID=522492 RepID=UPI00058F8FCF|nr:anion permease [Pseudomonas massiliensis]
MLMMTAGSAIMMILIHYATGTSPIIFGSGYVTLGLWWRVGLVMCLFELLAFALAGVVRWTIGVLVTQNPPSTWPLLGHNPPKPRNGYSR